MNLKKIFAFKQSPEIVTMEGTIISVAQDPMLMQTAIIDSKEGASLPEVTFNNYTLVIRTSDGVDHVVKGSRRAYQLIVDPKRSNTSQRAAKSYESLTSSYKRWRVGNLVNIVIEKKTGNAYLGSR